MDADQMRYYSAYQFLSSHGESSTTNDVYATEK